MRIQPAKRSVATCFVQPDTVVRWHRAGWRLCWRWRSNPGQGRPKVPAEARALIRRISLENPIRGAPSIHGELLKLGYDICESTIARYMLRRPGPPIQTWRTFIRIHMTEIAAIDFFTVHTATFRTLYLFLILSLDRRRVVHFNVTANPTAEWTAIQLVRAFPCDSAPRYLIRDRDGIYGQTVLEALEMMGIEQIVSAPPRPARCIAPAYIGPMQIIDFPDSIPLDDCLRTMVSVLSTTPDGLVETKGMLIQFSYPWHVLVADLGSIETRGPAHIAMSQIIPFIGEDCAILRICRGRLTAYSNPDLPRPYAKFDIRRDEDLRAINDLRLRRFGPGNGYLPGCYLDSED